jgi:Tol biopolymer transport system component
LYDAPGGEKLQDLPMAATLTAALRNTAGDWVFVTTGDGESGWTPVAGLVAYGLEQLPTLEIDAPSASAAGDSSSSATTEEAGAETVASAGTDASSTGAEAGTESATEGNSAGTGAAADVQGVPALVTITEQRLNIRSGPGSDYRILGKAQPGEELTAVARTADSQWVRVLRDDLGDVGGWVSTQFVEVEDLAGLPVDTSFEGDEPSSTVQPAVQPTAAASTPRAEQASTPAAEATAVAPATPPAEATAETEDPSGGLPTPTAQPTQARAAGDVSAQPAGLDGKIVFHDGRNNMYVYNLESGDIYWLTNGFDPDVSRDGSRVTFMRGGGDVNGIWTINIDGSNERRVHGGGEIMRGPKWSPDGDWIVFSRNFDTDKCYDLGQFFGCLSFFQLQRQFPSLPPEIIYDVIIDDADLVEQMNWNLTRINPDGGDFRDLPVQDSAVAPDWNEDGITYQARSGIEVTQDLPDGQTRPVIQEGWDWDPDWQPGGGRIVYQSKEGSHWEIWSINPDGSGVVALTRPETTLVDQLPSNVAPAFSPDGQHIIYLSNRTEDEEAGPWRLWVMDAGGGNKRPLPVDVEINYGFGGAQVAGWGR